MSVGQEILDPLTLQLLPLSLSLHSTSPAVQMFHQVSSENAIRVRSERIGNIDAL